MQISEIASATRAAAGRGRRRRVRPPARPDRQPRPCRTFAARRESLGAAGTGRNPRGGDRPSKGCRRAGKRRRAFSRSVRGGATRWEQSGARRVSRRFRLRSRSSRSSSPSWGSACSGCAARCCASESARGVAARRARAGWRGRCATATRRSSCRAFWRGSRAPTAPRTRPARARTWPRRGPSSRMVCTSASPARSRSSGHSAIARS
jgi:hypothetical protein